MKRIKNIQSIWTTSVCILAISAFTIIGIGQEHLDFVLGLNWAVVIGMSLFLTYLAWHDLIKGAGE